MVVIENRNKATPKATNINPKANLPPPIKFSIYLTPNVTNIIPIGKVSNAIIALNVSLLKTS